MQNLKPTDSEQAMDLKTKAALKQHQMHEVANFKH